MIALVPLLAVVTFGCSNDRRVIRKETDTYRTAQPSPVTSSKTTTVIETHEED